MHEHLFDTEMRFTHLHAVQELAQLLCCLPDTDN